MKKLLLIALLIVTSINASNRTKYIYFKDGTVKNYKEAKMDFKAQWNIKEGFSDSVKFIATTLFSKDTIINIYDINKIVVKDEHGKKLKTIRNSQLIFFSKLIKPMSMLVKGAPAIIFVGAIFIILNAI